MRQALRTKEKKGFNLGPASLPAHLMAGNSGGSRRIFLFSLRGRALKIAESEHSIARNLPRILGARLGVPGRNRRMLRRIVDRKGGDPLDFFFWDT